MIINSISGGKTSSYLYMNSKVNYNLFALVCNDSKECSFNDLKLNQLVNDKLQKYCSHAPEFIGTTEDIKTLKVVLDLEQLKGEEIIWLRDIESFDSLCIKKNAIPNQFKRFCTTELKLKPIFEWCLKYTNCLESPITMNIGFRYDEHERAQRFKEDIKYSLRGEYQSTGRKVHRWEFIKWRNGNFPLIDGKITHPRVIKFWEQFNKYSKIDFPIDSNCSMCFWKHEQQLRKNFDGNKNVMQWAKGLEQKIKRTFRKGNSLESIEKIGLQLDFNFGTGLGCSSDGFCSD